MREIQNRKEESMGSTGEGQDHLTESSCFKIELTEGCATMSERLMELLDFKDEKVEELQKEIERLRAAEILGRESLRSLARTISDLRKRRSKSSPKRRTSRKA